MERFLVEENVRICVFIFIFNWNFIKMIVNDKIKFKNLKV